MAGDFREDLREGLPRLFFVLENGGMMSEPLSVEDVAVVGAGGSAS